MARFNLRWLLLAATAVTIGTACNVSDSSESTSASTDDWSDADDTSAGDDAVFGTLDMGGNGNGNGNGYGYGYGYGNGNGNGHGPKACPEVALWCSSTGQALSPDPYNNCKYPPCP
ncbi:unnamed protein product [Phytophthora lilii]|uniref:Unnamed protein product n=1 Tax=Phytophthora lilii TaxID=2077276 RepID=A0A9W6TGK3_9STRA|nr:unnamed protein product [Phytophthora lilii]